MKIITWNLHGLPWFWNRHASRLERACEEACRLQPDVICFQEVWSEGDAARLARIASQFSYTLALSARGVGRATGGLLTFAGGRFDHVAKEAIFVEFRSHASEWRVLEGDGIAHKGVIAFELAGRQNGDRVTILNTHLQSQYGARSYKDVRQQQIRQIMEMLASQDASVPLFLCGDFNTTPDEVSSMMAGDAWVDLTAEFRAVCEKEYQDRCGTFIENSAGIRRWIDYVWFRQTPLYEVTATTRTIRNVQVDQPFSDHDGLVVDARITKRLATRFPRLIDVIAGPSPFDRRRCIKMLVAQLPLRL